MHNNSLYIQSQTTNKNINNIVANSDKPHSDQNDESKHLLDNELNDKHHSSVPLKSKSKITISWDIMKKQDKFIKIQEIFSI